MSIKDISATMAMYAQPTEYDQNAWKSAFDIANAFSNTQANRTKADDLARAYRENMATSDARVGYQNWNYGHLQNTGNLKLADDTRLYNNALQTDPSAIAGTIAQNQLNAATANNGLKAQQGAAQWRDIEAKYRFDYATGRMRTDEEVVNLARADGALTNASAINMGNQLARAYLNNQAAVLAPFNPMAASQFAYMGGSPFLLDGNNLTYGNTGAVIAQNLNSEALRNFAMGGGVAGSPAELTWQQKEDYKYAQQQQTVLGRALDEFVKMRKEAAEGGKLDPTEFANYVAELMDRNPAHRAYLNQYADSVAKAQGWHITAQPVQVGSTPLMR